MCSSDLSLLGVIFFFHYRIDRARHREIMQELETRRAAEGERA